MLLDECVPKRVLSEFPDHDVSTIEQAGLKGLKNGRLLNAASGSFDVLITVDKNIQYQQNLSKLPVAVVLLMVRSNRYESIVPLVPLALKRLATIRVGEMITIDPAQ